MTSLSDTIEQECEVGVDGRFGTLSYAALRTTDEGKYMYPYMTSDGLEEYVLSEEVQSALEEAVATLEDSIEVKTDKELDVKLAPSWVPGSDSVYVALNFAWERETTDEASEYICEVAAQGSSRAEPSRVTSVDCSLNLFPHIYCDGTVMFRTDNPHETIGNVDTFDEFIEFRAENSDKTEEELREQEDYADHYHPSSDDMITDICEFLTDAFEDEIVVQEPVRKAATGGELVVDGKMTGTLHAFARVEELIDWESRSSS